MRLELKRISPSDDEKISNMSRVYPIRMNVLTSSPESRKWLKSAAGRGSSSETRLSRTNNLEHTQKEAEMREKEQRDLNPRK